MRIYAMMPGQHILSPKCQSNRWMVGQLPMMEGYLFNVIRGEGNDLLITQIYRATRNNND